MRTETGRARRNCEGQRANRLILADMEHFAVNLTSNLFTFKCATGDDYSTLPQPRDINFRHLTTDQPGLT